MSNAARPGNMPPDIAREIIFDAKQDQFMTEGDYSSVGMLIIDSVIRQDAETVRILHDGLRRLYGLTLRSTSHRLDQSRILGLIDSTFWALRRLDGPVPPARFNPGGE